MRQFGSGRILICQPHRMDSAVAAGLSSPEGWNALLAGAGGEGAGRGTIVRVPLPGDGRLVLKQMRRGGMLARFRGDRYCGTGRLLRNLTVAMEAIRRGAPTPTPVLLLLRRRSGPSWEAWLGVEEIAGATDLRKRLSAGGSPGDEELCAAMRAVRALHDAGVVHPDLNLGNVLTRRDREGWSGFIVDLDGARILDRPATIRARRRALRRIERSYCKSFASGGPLGADGSDVWYRLYADGDAVLHSRLTRGRATARVGLAIHRLGWKLSGKR